MSARSGCVGRVTGAIGLAFVAVFVIVQLGLLLLDGDAISSHASGMLYQAELERSAGRPFVCRGTANAGTCCQVDIDGYFVPGRTTYCNHR